MFLQQLAAGLATGSIYALVAMGYTLIWKSMSLVNFSQGDLFMMGALFGYTLYAMGGLPFWVAVPLAVALSALLGVVLERAAIRPLKNAPPMNLLLATIAAGILLQNVAQLILGTDALPFPMFFNSETLQIGSVVMRSQDLVIIVVTITAIALLHVFFKHAKLGKAMRAVSIDPEISGAMGIPVSLVMMLTFSISSAFGGLAGILIAPIYFITPTMGVLVGLKAFTAAVVGGFNHVYGALIGGLLIGLIETFTASYVSSAYRDAIVFILLILVLRFKPTGILGTRTIEKV